MAAGKTTALRNSIVNATLRGVAYTPPVAHYVALHYGDPGDTGASNELAGLGYARQAITFSAPTNGECKNSADILFPTASGNWQTVTHFSIWDSVTAGTCLYQGPLVTPISILTGGNFKFISNSVSIKEV